MARLKEIVRGLGWVVALLIGVFWQHQNARINTINTISNLREQEGNTYRDIVALTDSFARVAFRENKTISPDELKRRVAPLNTQLDLRISDFEALEKQLAALENRPPRDVPLDFLRPSAPIGLKVTP